MRWTTSSARPHRASHVRQCSTPPPSAESAGTATPSAQSSNASTASQALPRPPDVEQYLTLVLHSSTTTSQQTLTAPSPQVGGVWDTPGYPPPQPEMP